MIKYLGSKRLLVPVLGDIASAVGARTAVDLFTGTTRVAQEFKRRSVHVTAVDSATYSDLLARCYVATDSTAVNKDDLRDAIMQLSSLPGRAGYFTRTFCEQSRYFQPRNGARIDAIRDYLTTHFASSSMFPILLTSLMEAADRVDSTTGVQMAYLKQWAPRAYNNLALRMPDLLPGLGASILSNALDAVATLAPVDLAYLDPPYNQHSYRGNYHIWETLARWDAPQHYGVACKRVDIRDPATKSQFNMKREISGAMESVVHRVPATVVVVSYNNESWLSPEQIMGWLEQAGHEDVRMLAFDSKRYVGAQIGIYNPAGHRVGAVSHLRNTEYVFIAGPTDLVEAATVAAHVPSRKAIAQTLF